MSTTKIYKKGFAGILAETFINSQLTPVIAIVSILLGIFSVILTPKEEEPQISVPMIDNLYGKTYIYIPKRRLELRLNPAGMSTFLVHSHRY